MRTDNYQVEAVCQKQGVIFEGQVCAVMMRSKVWIVLKTQIKYESSPEFNGNAK